MSPVFRMVSLEINDAVVLEQQQVLEQALSTNPKTQKALQKLIAQVIKEARDQVVSSTHFANGDPRGAAHSIRRTVYKKILGANINIYNSRKAGRPTSYEPPRKLREGQRGGNRMKRSTKTDRMMHYGPHDRGMVLRWLNTGTSGRESRYGKRGSIAPRNFFMGAAQSALSSAVDHLSQLIDKELMNILNKKK